MLACHQFSGPKDKDLTIIERSPGAAVTVWLGDLRFGKLKKGKGRDFDGTFRLSILVVIIIFLPAAFLVLINFYFVLIYLYVSVITVYHMQI